MPQILSRKRRSKGTKPSPRYAIFATRRGGEPVLVSKREFSLKDARTKAATLKRGLTPMGDSAFRTLVIKIVKQDTRR